MKNITQEEKKSFRFQRIVDAALVEFGTKHYEVASINQICKQGGIAKGSIYHYFKDKDALYLYCVRESIDALIEKLNQKADSFQVGVQGIQEYFSLRHTFFREYPNYAFIFTNALLNPPTHLIAEIKEIKVVLDIFNLTYYEKALEEVQLKEDFTKNEAIEYFLIFQESFNHYFQQKTYDNYQDLIVAHEVKLNKLLKIILYGMVQEEEDSCFH